jgi:hypothetical protein
MLSVRKESYIVLEIISINVNENFHLVELSQLSLSPLKKYGVPLFCALL